MTTLADLIAKVAAEHDSADSMGFCQCCGEKMPCDAARLAAALSVENVAAALRATYTVAVVPAAIWQRDAAALLAALVTVAG